MLVKLDGQDLPASVIATLSTGSDKRFHLRGPAVLGAQWQALIDDQEHVLEFYDTSGEVPMLTARAYVRPEHLFLYSGDGAVELTGPARGGMDGGAFFTA